MAEDTIVIKVDASGLEEAVRLAVEIADCLAFSSFEGMCNTEEIDGEFWTDLDTDCFGDDVPAHEEFKDEIRYCELRGLLRRHPQRPNLVQQVEAADEAEEENPAR